MIASLIRQARDRLFERKSVEMVVLGSAAWDELRADLFADRSNTEVDVIRATCQPRLTIEGFHPMKAGARHMGLAIEFRVDHDLVAVLCDETLSQRSIRWNDKYQPFEQRSQLA